MLESATPSAPPVDVTSRLPDVSSPSVDGESAVPEKGLPLRLGVLTDWITPALADEVVANAGALQRRTRLLPARAVVYFVLALCLFSGADGAGPPGYRSVARELTNGLRGVLPGVRLPTSAALSRARQRLGVEPLRLLFERLRGPRADPATPGVYAFDRRLVAWDGTGLDVPDTPDNAAEFGRHGGTKKGSKNDGKGGSGKGGGGHPQLRLLNLIECGTHALLAAAFGGWAVVDELTLARQVLDALTAGMLLLADRNFPGYQLWGQAVATGADLLWRVRSNLIFTPVRQLPDGSFLTVMGSPEENTRRCRARAAGRPLPGPPDGHLVRLIEYTVTVIAADGNSRTETFRLVTTLLDPVAAPAQQLAELYHQRWEIELSNAEIKTRLRGPEVILRSRIPQLVRQEMFAFLVVYQSLCCLRVHAAHACGIDPDRISFTVTVRLARDQVCNQAARTTAALAHALEQTVTDLLDDLLPPRRARSYERKKRPPKNTFPSRRSAQPRPPSKITYAVAISSHEPYQGKRVK